VPGEPHPEPILIGIGACRGWPRVPLALALRRQQRNPEAQRCFTQGYCKAARRLRWVARVMAVNVALRVAGKPVKEKTARVCQGLGLLESQVTTGVISQALALATRSQRCRPPERRGERDPIDDSPFNGLTSLRPMTTHEPVGGRSRHRSADSGSIQVPRAHPGQCALEVDHIIPRKCPMQCRQSADTDRTDLFRDSSPATEAQAGEPEARVLLRIELAACHRRCLPGE